jgi:hypothetical protein
MHKLNTITGLFIRMIHLQIRRMHKYVLWIALDSTENVRFVYAYFCLLSRVNHDNENVRTIGQDEDRHRNYKRLELGGRQAYDRSGD